MEKLLSTIFSVVKSGTDITSYRDLKNMCHDCMKTDISLGVKYLKKLSAHIESVIPKIKDDDLLSFYELHKSVLLLAAPYDFESYLLYVESNRDPK